MTPEGEKLLESHKTGYGRPLGSPQAAEHPEEHIGRRRAVPPAIGNDPTGDCTPAGLTRNILSTYFSPLEFVQAKDRIIHHFEWTNEWREIFMDGRQLPQDPDILKWNGYSVGRWDGDTFVVDSFGFEPTTWVDHFGYPHSEQMQLEERIPENCFRPAGTHHDTYRPEDLYEALGQPEENIQNAVEGRSRRRRLGCPYR